MKILFITGVEMTSNSSATLMNLAYIKGLIETNNDITIVYPDFPKNHVSKNTGHKLPDNIKIHKLKMGSIYNTLSNKKNIKRCTHLRNIIRSILKKVAIYDTTKVWIKNIKNIQLSDNYDLIISSSDPKHSHIFAKKLIDSGKVKSKQWIQMWGDPFYSDITKKGTLLKLRIYREEKKLIKAGDKVFYVSPLTLKAQKKIFKKFAYKMNNILIPYFTVDNTFPKDKEPSDIVFGYFGDYHSKYRNITPLYEALNESDSLAYIRGHSNKKLHSTNFIDVEERVSISELENLEKKTDAFIHLSNKNGTQIPAKVYYYSGTKKPIIFVLDGYSEEIENMFMPYQRYIFCKNNKEDIIRAINIVKNKDYPKEYNRIVEELSPSEIVKKLLAYSEDKTWS